MSLVNSWQIIHTAYCACILDKNFWRLNLQSLNYQIKTTTKISLYMVAVTSSTLLLVWVSWCLFVCLCCLSLVWRWRVRLRGQLDFDQTVSGWACCVEGVHLHKHACPCYLIGRMKAATNRSACLHQRSDVSTEIPSCRSAIAGWHQWDEQPKFRSCMEWNACVHTTYV